MYYASEINFLRLVYESLCCILNSAILHLMSEANLMEDTLMRILVIGLARELPLSPADAMDIADKLVARAANAHTNGMSGPLMHTQMVC